MFTSGVAWYFSLVVQEKKSPTFKLFFNKDIVIQLHLIANVTWEILLKIKHEKLIKETNFKKKS